ncbi:uncharacterized protein LOC120843240 [Ixodes scapularis]|uniref:uncharacterized protein LOC120843240 n=1 Tax=Ixodes scapularis TaxID=6945 RepID=UPI001C37FCF7|nr:uncharacterized protein LOC120843240 [Ixodes scapularis]
MELADTDASVQVTLPLSSINEYVAQEFATSRLLLEGEAVLEAGHVVTCSVKEKVDSNSTFVGFVLQTSALSRDPHEVEIVVKEKTVAAASCSCKAGSYKCKHIVAMLLYIHATKVFEILSSTDLPQQWGKSQKQGVKDKYAPRPIIELPCVKKARLFFRYSATWCSPQNLARRATSTAAVISAWAKVTQHQLNWTVLAWQ